MVVALWTAHVHSLHSHSHSHHWSTIWVVWLLSIWVVRSCGGLLWLRWQSLLRGSLSGGWVERWDTSLKDGSSRGVASGSDGAGVLSLSWAGDVADIAAVLALESFNWDASQAGLVVVEVLLSMRLRWSSVDVIRIQGWGVVGRIGRLQLWRRQRILAVDWRDQAVSLGAVGVVLHILRVSAWRVDTGSLSWGASAIGGRGVAVLHASGNHGVGW